MVIGIGNKVYETKLHQQGRVYQHLIFHVDRSYVKLLLNRPLKCSKKRRINIDS